MVLNGGGQFTVSCLTLNTPPPHALLLKLLPYTTAPPLTHNVKPERDVGWLHRNHPNNFCHFVAFHDGEVVEGFIESQGHG